MEKISRVLKWIVLNAFIAGALWLGFFEGVEGAKNVALFLTWTFFFLSFAFFTDDVQKTLVKKGRVIPSFLTIGVDMAFVLTYVWFGYVFTGIAALLSMIFVGVGWEKADQLKKRKEENEREKSQIIT